MSTESTEPATPEAAEPATPEAAEPADGAAGEPGPQPLDRSWDALQRQEARLRERSEQIKSQSQNLERLQKIEALRETDPIGAARLAGLDPIALGALALGQQQDEETPEQRTEKTLGTHAEQMKRLEQQLSDMRAEKQQLQLHNQLRTIVKSSDDLGVVGLHLDRDPGYLKALQARAAESGASDWGEFLKQEEEQQTEIMYAAVKQLLPIGKIRDRILEDLKAGETPPAETKPVSPPRTLRNRQQADPPTVDDKPGETMQERRKRALDALLSQKK